MKTLGELEAEDQAGFHNKTMTITEQIELDRLTAARRDYEAIHTPIADPSDEEDEDEDEQ
jgi:hypothetical protein